MGNEAAGAGGAFSSPSPREERTGGGPGRGKPRKHCLKAISYFAPLSLSRREHRIPRGDESRRSGLATVQRTVLPLLGERAGVRGKKRPANQRACELPMKPTTL